MMLRDYQYHILWERLKGIIEEQETKYSGIFHTSDLLRIMRDLELDERDYL